MNALVTGGGGFLGSRIARMLKARGDSVTVFARGDYPLLAKSGISVIRGDVRDARAIEGAVAGQDVVFHVVGLTGIWGPRKPFWDVNFGGTRNVIAACRAKGVSRLVYTSSPSVVFGGDEMCGVDESQPYPPRHLTAYSESKAAAEREVLAANHSRLATLALRPHLIWGPGDPHLIPRVLDRARRGRLVQIGDGANRVDITYIDNAAHAHVLGADRLSPGAACAGRTYFISQGEPVRLWPWFGGILDAEGIAPVNRRMSYRQAYYVGYLFEIGYKLIGSTREPPMTRFLANQLATSHYFNIDAARRELGYEPIVDTNEGLCRTLAALRKGSVCE